MPSRPDGALVTATWANDHDLGIGDELLLTGASPETPPLTIVGLLDGTGVGALSGGSVIVVGQAILAPPTFLVPTPVTAIDLAIRDGFLDDVQDALDAVMAEPFVVETVEDAAAAFERVQAGFAGIAFLLFGAMNFFTHIGLIVHTM